MKAVCPKDPTHDRFVTTAVVSEDWVVNEHGDWDHTLRNGEIAIYHYPDPDNEWTCHKCGAEAEVTP